MLLPSPSEEYISIIDNKGREKIQRVVYIVWDVRKEKIHITAEGLNYATDSLKAKRQTYLVEKLEKLVEVLKHPDLVIWDPVEIPGDTLIYYKWLYFSVLGRQKLTATIIKIRQDVKFFYNFHLQENGKIKGLSVVPPSEIDVWYISPRVKRSQFGL